MYISRPKANISYARSMECLLRRSVKTPRKARRIWKLTVLIRPRPEWHLAELGYQRSGYSASLLWKEKNLQALKPV